MKEVEIVDIQKKAGGVFRVVFLDLKNPQLFLLPKGYAIVDSTLFVCWIEKSFEHCLESLQEEVVKNRLEFLFSVERR